MSTNFKEIINKGIPISTPVTILFGDLIGMSKDKERLIKRVDKEFNKYTSFIRENIAYLNIEIFKTMCIISDPVTLEKRLHFYPEGFISSLLFNLNVNRMCSGVADNRDTLVDISEQSPEISARIEKLRHMISENRFEKEFPVLYKKYKFDQELYDTFKKLEKTFANPKLAPAKKLEILKGIAESYKNAGMKFDFDAILEKAKSFSLKSFCQEYADGLELLLKNSDQVIEFLMTHSLSIDKLGIDSEELELYIAHRSMRFCEQGSKEDKQRFIYYVSNYFNSDESRKTNDSLTINVDRIENENIKASDEDREGIKLTPKLLYERYKTFLVNNPSIRVIDLRKVDFSTMTLEEVEEFMSEYLRDLQSNWELIPPTAVLNGIPVIPRRQKNPMTQEEIEKYKKHLEELYLEKLALYGSTDPFMRVRGKNTFAGYIGHIYSNGKVILDKFFENDKTKRLAYGDAIYIMDIADFYILSQYPKSVLKNMPGIQRIEHRNTNGISWKDQVLNAIQSGSHQYRTADEVKQLVKAKKLEE